MSLLDRLREIRDDAFLVVPISLEKLQIEKQGYVPPEKIVDVFRSVLDRIKFKIVLPDGRNYIRDVRSKPYSSDIEYGLKGDYLLPNGEHAYFYPAIIRCSDSPDTNTLGVKSEIYMPMFYNLDGNPDCNSNGWDIHDQTVVIDCCLTGGSTITLIVDGKELFIYRPGGKVIAWTHLNLVTGEVKVI